MWLAVLAMAGCSSGQSRQDAGDIKALDVVSPDTIADVARDTVVVPDSVDVLSDIPRGDDVPNVGDTSSDTSELPPDCNMCNVAQGCPSNQTCIEIPGGRACTCVDDGDCRNGFLCNAFGNDGLKACLSAHGCPPCAFYWECPGQCCNHATGQCVECGANCASCRFDYECAAGYRCNSADGLAIGRCVPECRSGECRAAPVGSAPGPIMGTCSDRGRGIEVCVLFEDPCPACEGPTPYSLADGTCVQCRDSWDCPTQQECDGELHQCVDAMCDGGMVFCDDRRFCMQCCVDADCARFAGTTGKCQVDGTCEGYVPCGGLCTPESPACVWQDGAEVCAQCRIDGDCEAAGYHGCHCSGTTDKSCVTWDGVLCGSDPRECAFRCTGAADCQEGPSGVTMECVDVPGLDHDICADSYGRCGDFMACCMPGQTCTDILEILRLILDVEMLSLIIAPPHVNSSYCECETTGDCLAGQPCTDTAFICEGSQDALGEMYDKLCPEGSLDSRFPDRLCIDPAVLQGYFGLVP